MNGKPTNAELVRIATAELENAASNLREIARASKQAAQILEQRVAAINGLIRPEETKQ